MSASQGGDMARTVILPMLAHSSSNCWWYFLANLMNSHLPTSSPNLSRFWVTRGLILTLGTPKIRKEGLYLPHWAMRGAGEHTLVNWGHRVLNKGLVHRRLHLNVRGNDDRMFPQVQPEQVTRPASLNFHDVEWDTPKEVFKH